MSAAAVADAPNRRVILKRYVTGFPAEDDMEVVAGAAQLAVPPESAAVVVKVRTRKSICLATPTCAVV